MITSTRRAPLILVTLCLAATGAQADSWKPAAGLGLGHVAHSVTLLPNGTVIITGGDEAGASDYDRKRRIYDPVTNSWHTTAAMSGTPRYSQTATVLNNGDLLVAGGYDGFETWAVDRIRADFNYEANGYAAHLLVERCYHTATLLPDGRVLVVGGAVAVPNKSCNGSALSSVELFNPVTSNWSLATPMAGARYLHTATLLANGKVLVVGGATTGPVVAPTSELYDPATNTWTTVATPIAPRALHSATLLTNGNVLVAGGVSDVAYLSSAEVYNPTSNTWTATPALSTTRAEHSAILLPSGKVMIAGGDNAGFYFASTQIYDPATNAWADGPSMADYRKYQGATLLPDGRVLMVGGYDGSYLPGVEIYDASDGAWAATAPMAAPRRFHISTLLPNGEVLVAGGANSAGIAQTTAEIYNPALANWRAAAPMLTGRQHFASSLLATGQVLVTGGQAYGTTPTAELYEPSADAWTATPMLTAREHHTSTLLQDGRVLVAGGFTTSVELFDPHTRRWTAAAPMATVRGQHSATLLTDGRVLVAGGFNTTNQALNSAEIYNPATNTWSAAGTLTGTCYFHDAALLANGKVLVGPCLGTARPNLYDPSTNSWSAAVISTVVGGQKTIVLPNGTAVFPVANTTAVFHPGLDTWSYMTGHPAKDRSRAEATLLANGKVLVTGGFAFGDALNDAELFDAGLATDKSRRAIIGTITDPVLPNNPLVITGSGFRPPQEANGGNNMGSASNFALVRIMSLGNEQLRWLSKPLDWTLNSDSYVAFTAADMDGFPVGYFLVTVFVNGVPSVSRLVLLAPDALFGNGFE